MPKPDFRKVKDERKPWVTQEVVAPEQVIPESSAKPAPGPAITPVTEDKQQARTHVRRSASMQAQEKRSTIIETLYRQLQSKKHLSSYTFRYRPEELDELERIFTQIEGENPGKVSRNDLARLALNALFEDYRSNGEVSTLALVLKRM